MPVLLPDSITSPFKEELEAIFEGRVAEDVDKLLLHSSINFERRSANLFNFILYAARKSEDLAEYFIGNSKLNSLITAGIEAEISQVHIHVSEEAICSYSDIFRVPYDTSRIICEERAKGGLFVSAERILTKDINVYNWWSIKVYNAVDQAINRNFPEADDAELRSSLLSDAKSYFNCLFADYLRDKLCALEEEDRLNFQVLINELSIGEDYTGPSEGRSGAESKFCALDAEVKPELVAMSGAGGACHFLVMSMGKGSDRRGSDASSGAGEVLLEGDCLGLVAGDEIISDRDRLLKFSESKTKYLKLRRGDNL